MSNRSSLPHFLIQGLQHKLAKALDIDEPMVKFTNDPFAVPLIEGGGYRVDNGRIQYPYTSLRPTSVATDEETYRASYLSKVGFAKRFGLSGDGDSAAMSRFSVTPVTLAFEFQYVTDDPAGFMDFALRWVHVSNAKLCNYAVRYEGSRFEVRTVMDPMLDVPEREGGTESQQQGVATAQVVIHAYAAGAVETVDKKSLSPTLVMRSLTPMKPTK